jgi:hypothetical protein
MEPTLASLAEKLDAVAVSVEKTRRYMQWTLIITTVALLLPVVAALFIVPIALSSYGAALQMLTQ